MERHHFEAELQALRNQLLTMGGLVEQRMHRAVQALVHRGEEDAQRIIATDKEINDLQIEIDELLPAPAGDADPARRRPAAHHRPR